MNVIEKASTFFRNNDFIVWFSLLALGMGIFYRREIADEVQLFKTDRKLWFKTFVKEWIIPIVIALVLAFGVVRPFIIGPYKIPTGSMIPTFLVGDRIFVDKISYRFSPPKRGDIVVFKYPLDKKKDFVKRLVGLPGDEIEIRDGKLIINDKVMEDPPFSEHYYYNNPDWSYGKEGQKVKVPADMCFVLGDNSAQSSDSRNWGFVPRKNVVGKAFLIWLPLNRIKFVK